MSTRFALFDPAAIGEAVRTPRILASIGVFIALASVPVVTGDAYLTYVAGWILCFAIVALGYNVLLGYTGLLSFGHAAFFGAGVYTTALLMHHTEVRDLLVLLFVSALVAAALGLVIGALSLRSHEIYFALLTLALAQLLYVLTVRFNSLSGGTDGISVDRFNFLGIPVGELAPNVYLMGFYYHVILIVFGLCVVTLWLMMRSPFGLTLKTIRENPTRARSTGVPVQRYRLYSMVVSAIFPGIAGALYAVHIGHVTPEYLDWTMSGDIVFMTLLGGIGTFIGPAVGAAGYILLEQFATQYVGGYWHFTMGAIIFVVVLTLRERGIWGGAKDAVANLRRRSR
ncbi:branched-chain amino acid ABC transporter permease [Natronobeatus ordinarius]|uniref:branched-chain amino acid ABC transporter permease n=1 Tax=Natronobeatus ordinarius TaxID=2963433 RepID=UPI0020CFA5ED|nr:branched-chain amino acid ABC transporter permease [Natronobeatus ordinarius]